jgi:trimeric autotransporter adhesin
MTTLTRTNSLRRSPLRRALLLIPLVLACFALGSPTVQAVNPPPDGGYGNQNTAEGTDALFSLTSGVWNVAVGFQALHSDTSGNQNTAVGYKALLNNLTGDHSTAFGSQALLNNTTGNDNVANGFNTLFSNTSGNRNTGNGFRTLNFNNGDDNTATGFNALYNNRTGVENTATGSQALLHGSDFSDNTAVGYQALYNNAGFENTAVGAQALFTNTTGVFNVAVGDFALALNDTTVTQGANTALGSIALTVNTSGFENTAVGRRALEFSTTGSNNTAVGWRAGDNVITASGTVCIGSFTTGANDDNTTYIRNVGSTVQPFSAGVVDFVTVRLSDNRLGHTASSRRYKEDIQSMDKASEVIYQLKPVTYRYKKDIEPTQNLDYGLVAEDVAKIDPKLAIRDGNGQIESVRYLAIYNMMLNEFLKEHRTVEDLKSTVAKQEAIIAQQQKGMELLAASLKDQAAQIQKVSAQVAVNKSTPKLVLNKP